MDFPPQEHINGARAAEKAWFKKTRHRIWTSASLGQVAIESAFLKRQSGVNNFGGIKANKAEIAAGQFRKDWTHEDIGGKTVRVQADFASYPSVAAFYEAHGRVIATYSGYRAGWAAKTADEFLAGIAHPYATAPKAEYIAAVKGVMDHYGLRKYDLTEAELTGAKQSTVLTHPATQGAAGGMIGVAATAAALQGANLPWPLIGAAAVVAGVIGLLVYLDRRKLAAAAAHAASVPAMTIEQVHAYLELPPPVPAPAPMPAPIVSAAPQAASILAAVAALSPEPKPAASVPGAAQ